MAQVGMRASATVLLVGCLFPHPVSMFPVSLSEAGSAAWTGAGVGVGVGVGVAVGTSNARSADEPPPRGDRPVPGARFAWPLRPRPDVTTAFRPPSHPFGPGHRGVDLAGAAGQAVLAAGSGTVVFAGQLFGRGVVSVQHDGGLRTTYEPLSPAVTVGTLVQVGDVLGRLEPGHAGCPVPACLHWGVRRARDDYLDPLVLLRPAHVRLLPVPVPWPPAAAGQPN